MTICRFLLLLFILTIFVPWCSAEVSDLPAVKTAQETLEKENQSIISEYTAGIKKRLTAAQERGNLDLCLQLKKELDGLEAQDFLPSKFFDGNGDTVKKIVTGKIKQNQRKFESALEDTVKELTKNGKFDEAHELREYLNTVRKSGIGSKTPTNTTPKQIDGGSGTPKTVVPPDVTEQLEKNARRSLGADLKLYGKNIDDSDFDWESLRGKYVVVKFTATWCGPCRGEIPGMIRAYEKYHDKGLEIVSVYIWEKGDDSDKLNERIKEFAEKEKINWQIISEPLTLKAGGEKIGAFYGISGVPTMLLIDKDGKIIDTAARGQHLQERLAEIFDGIVNENSEPERKDTQKQPKPSDKFRSSQNSWPSQQDLAAAPADFYKKGKEIADEVKAKGGFAVAGQVVEKRGMPLKRGTYTVALKYNDYNAQDTYRFENGWFITRAQTNSNYNKIIAASFQHNEVEVPVPIEQGKVNFQQVFLEQIPKAKLVTLKGIVQNEKDRPVPNAQITLTIDRSNGYFNSPTSINTITDSNGQYSFSGIPFQAYRLGIRSQAYRLDTSSVQNSYSYTSCKVQPGSDKQSWVIESYDGLSRQEGERIVSTILFPRRVIIDSIYQPDGSTDFSKGNVLKNRYALELFGRHGTAMGTQKTGSSIIFDPIAEKSNWGYYESDLILLVLGGKCTFRHTYTNGKVGHYDLGEVDFDLVKNAAPEKIRGGDSPCELNHVYVVKTYQKGHYAKFIVRSIEIIVPQ